MLKKSVAICAFALAATPAFADMSSCYEPIPPAAVDGAAATEQQMMHAQSDVKEFIKSSDDYQTCLNSELLSAKKKAKNSKDKTPLDPSIESGVQSKIDSNQKLKEKVGAEFNTSVLAYKAKHP